MMDEYTFNYSYDENGTIPDMFEESSFERGFLTSANVGIFLCIVGTFLNITQIVLLLASPVLRKDYLYIQILNITFADLGFVVTVDSFTVYYELEKWSLGVAFCKAWMLLDTALPYVSLIAILFLNADRIFFTHETRWYSVIMSHPLSRMVVLFSPWCLSAIVVCTLWLGFSEIDPVPGVCIYGITKEANTASMWLTVFLPTILILVLCVFVFIAGIGEMPSQSMLQSGLTTTTTNNNYNNNNSSSNNERGSGRGSGQGWIPGNAESSREGIVIATWSRGSSMTHHHRRFIAALLAVDFVTLTLTLPFPAFTHTKPVCFDVQTCHALRSLFQTLSWMRSSVVCVRPLIFSIFTDIRQSCVRDRRFRGHRNTPSGTGEASRSARERSSCYRNETVRLTSFVESTRVSQCHHLDERTTSTVAITPPNSPCIHKPVNANRDVESNSVVSF